MKLIPQKLEIGWKLHNPNFNRFAWSTHETDVQTDNSI